MRTQRRAGAGADSDVSQHSSVATSAKLVGMAFPTQDEIFSRIDPIASSHGLDIEQIKITKAGAKSAVMIALDSDSRPDLDLLEVVAGEIGDAFDAAEAAGELNFGAGYTLEVGTPGVDTPLSQPRHWRRNRGRKVALTTAGAKEFYRIGALNDAESNVILIARNNKTLTVTEYELASDATAMVEIEFSTVPADEQAVVDLEFDEAIAWREENK